MALVRLSALADRICCSPACVCRRKEPDGILNESRQLSSAGRRWQRRSGRWTGCWTGCCEGLGLPRVVRRPRLCSPYTPRISPTARRRSPGCLLQPLRRSRATRARPCSRNRAARALRKCACVTPCRFTGLSSCVCSFCLLVVLMCALRKSIYLTNCVMLHHHQSRSASTFCALRRVQICDHHDERLRLKRERLSVAFKIARHERCHLSCIEGDLSGAAISSAMHCC